MFLCESFNPPMYSIFCDKCEKSLTDANGNKVYADSADGIATEARNANWNIGTERHTCPTCVSTETSEA